MKQNPLEALFHAFRSLLARRAFQPRRPLEISLHGRALHFRDLTAFAFCLKSRTTVPAWRTDALLRRPPEELRAEAWTLRTLENQIGGILEDGERHGISCIRTLKPLGTRMFSKDHHWRALFEQLVTEDCGQEIHVRAALSRYLEYLAARREVLELVTSLRHDADRHPKAPSGEGAFKPDKATVVFDAAAAAVSDHDHPAMRRLPHGEAVRLTLSGGKHLDIRLAGHPFSLSRAPEWCLSDDKGRRFALRPGVNAIGRSRDNDIAVDAGLHDISRRHLLAQPLGPEEIELVDLSSAGTFVATDTAA